MAEPVCQSTDVKYQYAQLSENERITATLDNTARSLEQTLAVTTDPRERVSLMSAIDQIRGARNIMYSLRPKLLSQIGIKFPRVPSLLSLVAGLSPGQIKIWHDPESGLFTEARTKPGAPPVYKHVTDEVAIAILKGELTKELEAELMKPDEYLGE